VAGDTTWSEDLGKVVFTVDARAGVPIRITKFFTYHSSRNVPPAELVDRCWRTLDRAMRRATARSKPAQRAYLADFWARADVQVEGPPRSSRRSAGTSSSCPGVGRAETTGIPAKGLTGQAYEGHYFWDTEIYVAAVPDLHRAADRPQPAAVPHSMLPTGPRARPGAESERARCSRGARSTARRPRPTTQAGTAQYHINADIAYAIKRTSTSAATATC
jgi:alpha,alpha-trehalose phosphorylase